MQYATEFYVDLTEKFQAKILHVDDEPSILKVARQCLEMEGHFQVDSAISVKEAEKKMKKHTYDVIVSDYMMPDRNGLEFLGDLRRTGNLIPFIMFTGKGREEVAVKALNLGADQYVNKIGDPETVYLELAHGIRKAIERRRAHDRIIESEEKFRNIFESANDAMIYLEIDRVHPSHEFEERVRAKSPADWNDDHLDDGNHHGDQTYRNIGNREPFCDGRCGER